MNNEERKKIERYYERRGTINKTNKRVKRPNRKKGKRMKKKWKWQQNEKKNEWKKKECQGKRMRNEPKRDK